MNVDSVRNLFCRKLELSEGIKCSNSQLDKECYSDFESVCVLLSCLDPESDMRLYNTTLIGPWSVNGFLISCLYSRIFYATVFYVYIIIIF
jgi:hypothetical protein